MPPPFVHEIFPSQEAADRAGDRRAAMSRKRHHTWPREATSAKVQHAITVRGSGIFIDPSSPLGMTLKFSAGTRSAKTPRATRSRGSRAETTGIRRISGIGVFHTEMLEMR